jgi:hypothetical protein
MTAAALAALALLPAAAYAGTESVTAGDVTATLRWSGEAAAVSNAALTIARGGVTAFDAPIPDVVCDGCVVQNADDVRLANLDADGEPEVLVVANTGAAYCCTLAGLYDFAPATGRYVELVQGFQSSGFNLDDLDGDGVHEFVTRDGRFEEKFGPHAVSFPPVAVYRLEDGALADVTRSYPAAIRANAADAKRLFKRFRRGDPGAEGVVSAYVADQYLLGKGATGLRELDRQIKRGIVKKSFRSKLLKLLRRYGYR